MASQLAGKTIAVLITNGFEQAAVSRTEIVSLGEGEVRGWKDKDWDASFPVNVALKSAGGDIPRSVPHPAQSCRFREELFRCRQAAGCNLPRTVDAGGIGRAAQAIMAGRHPENGRQLGGPGSGERRRAGDKPSWKKGIVTWARFACGRRQINCRFRPRRKELTWR